MSLRDSKQESLRKIPAISQIRADSPRTKISRRIAKETKRPDATRRKNTATRVSWRCATGVKFIDLMVGKVEHLRGAEVKGGSGG